MSNLSGHAGGTDIMTMTVIEAAAAAMVSVARKAARALPLASQFLEGAAISRHPGA
jgi:hypothetical protein